MMQSITPTPQPPPASSTATSTTSPSAIHTPHHGAAHNTRRRSSRHMPTPHHRHTLSDIRTQPAAPHVISSLIDQLSAVALPAHNHFENLLVGYGDGPSLPCSPGLPDHGHAADPRPYSHADPRDHGERPSDDVCEPPVVRTAKPPSGRSPLTAPKKPRDKAHPLAGYACRSGSSCSLHSTHSAHSAASFGAISIETPAAKTVPAASSRSSAESRRSLKGHRSLMYMSSRERLRQKETERERKRASAHALDDNSVAAESLRKAATPLFPYEDTIKEEPFLRDDPPSPMAEPPVRVLPRPPSRSSSSPRRLRINLVDDLPSERTPEKGLIPELIPDRGSSLRHTGSPSRRTKRRKSPEKQRERPNREAGRVPEREEKKNPTAATVAEAPAARAAEPEQSKPEQKKPEQKKQEEEEEDQVTQRIRVLKEQKMRRHLLAARPPGVADTGTATRHTPQLSPDAASELSPTSSTSSASDPRVQDLTKAHRVLGISLEAQSPGDHGGSPLPRRDARYFEPPPVPPAPSIRHAPHPLRLPTDGDEVAASFPINYALAMRHLEDPLPLSPVFEPPTPSFSPASGGGASISSEPSATQRKSPAAVGDRSGLGRRTATDSVLLLGGGGPPKHKHSTSASDMPFARPTPAPRSASADRSGRHRPTPASRSPAPNPPPPRRQRTLSAKARWSHPDLPNKADKSHNARMKRTEAKAAAAAVQSPERPVVEERPASLDSIDIDVQSHLNSPRLSQTIKHPQTGRIISFSEVGDPRGYAVFVCVGMGLTRFVMAFYDQLATTLKLRLITPDRPGVGGSQADPTGTPLSWPDDVLLICQTLDISKFSLLAHSAGAVYALATSLRVPQHIRGRVHLLAPWIPPSQMAPVGISQNSPPTQQLPRSQRFLRALPPSLLKVANSAFLSGTSASLQRTGPKTAPRTRRKGTTPQAVQPTQPTPKDDSRQSMMLMDQELPPASPSILNNPADPNYDEMQRLQEALSLAERERQHAFDERLTFAIWDRATAHANPATDLMVCLETKQTIGFRYEDINRPVVIHHGSKDSRVPVANIRWLGKLMRKCEVRILDGEPHGLMASAQVMGNVLTEIATDWEDWNTITTDHRTLHRRRTTEKLRSQMSFSNLSSNMT